jgi:tetratricopeptide (TPR) repeat protein
MYYQVGGDLATAEHFGEQLLALGMHTRDPDVLLGAHTALGITAVHQGQITLGHDHLQKAITFHDASQHGPYVARFNLDPGVYAGPGLQRTFWLLGFPDQAGQMTVQTLRWCDLFQDPQSVAFIHVFAAFYYQFVQDIAQARRMAEICIAICDEHGIVQEREWVAPVYGWAQARSGSVQEGLEVLRASLARHRSIQSQLNVPYYMTLLAETLLESGEVADGLQVTEDALQVVEQTQQRSFLAEIYRLKGELLFKQRPEDPSAAEFVRRAVDLAEAQSARSLQLRAAISLCRMAEGTARIDEARAILRRVYDTFTEGFGGRDLLEARKALQS